MGMVELGLLQQRLRDLASARLGRVPDFSFFRDLRYFGNKLVVLCADRGTGVDLACCVMSHIGRYRRRSVVHLGATYSRMENRGLMQMVYLFGLINILMNNLLFRKVYLTSLTHTPKIFGVVDRCFERVYPGLDPDAEPEGFHLEIRDILERTYLREWHFTSPPIIDRRFVVRGLRVQEDGRMYIPDTRETVPLHRIMEYNKRCFELIDYERGDDVLQVGIFSGILTLIKNLRLFAKG